MFDLPDLDDLSMPPTISVYLDQGTFPPLKHIKAMKLLDDLKVATVVMSALDYRVYMGVFSI